MYVNVKKVLIIGPERQYSTTNYYEQVITLFVMIVSGCTSGVILKKNLHIESCAVARIINKHLSRSRSFYIRTCALLLSYKEDIYHINAD